MRHASAREDSDQKRCHRHTPTFVAHPRWLRGLFHILPGFHSFQNRMRNCPVGGKIILNWVVMCHPQAGCPGGRQWGELGPFLQCSPCLSLVFLNGLFNDITHIFVCSPPSFILGIFSMQEPVRLRLCRLGYTPMFFCCPMELICFLL